MKPSRIFVNNYGGGNFLSEDGGETWRVSSDGYTGALMAQVAVAQDDPARVYASARSGLFASRDGGDTWQGLGYGVARTLEGLALAIDPNDALHVLAILMDGGQTWRGVDTGLWGPENPPTLGETLLRIVFSPSDPQMVFAAVGNRECRQDVPLVRGNCKRTLGRGVIVSHDGGETWTQTGFCNALAALPVALMGLVSLRRRRK